MSEKYLQHYLTLGVEPGCTRKEIKSAYRRLAREWHPDRHVGSSPGKQGKRQAEERFKEINHAYWSLSQYYRAHGHLPFTPPSSSPQPATESLNTPSSQPAPAIIPLFGLWRYLLVGVLLGLAYFFWNHSPDSVNPSVSATVVEQIPPEKQEYFSVGSRFGEVYGAQGAPTRTENDIWYYGNSRVYFSQGKVTHWEEDPANPLMVMKRKNDNEYLLKNNNYFSIGSTKQEVRVIQGSPLRETDSLWEYRVSRIYFRNDRVTGWYSSPLDPLRVRPE